MTDAPARRCPWARSALDVAYHDTEWGVPQHDDRALFEFLTLEGAQAGLSWSTILNKRPAYRAAYCDFDVARVAAFGDADRARLRGPSSRSSASSAASTVTCGSAWTAGRSTTYGMRWPTCRPARRCRTRCRRT